MTTNEIRRVSTCFTGTFAVRNRGSFMPGVSISARHDVREADALIAGYSPGYVIADTTYDSDALRTKILAQGSVAVIRPRCNRLQECP